MPCTMLLTGGNFRLVYLLSKHPSEIIDLRIPVRRLGPLKEDNNTGMQTKFCEPSGCDRQLRLYRRRLHSCTLHLLNSTSFLFIAIHNALLYFLLTPHMNSTLCAHACARETLKSLLCYTCVSSGCPACIIVVSDIFTHVS